MRLGLMACSILNASRQMRDCSYGSTKSSGRSRDTICGRRFLDATSRHWLHITRRIKPAAAAAAMLSPTMAPAIGITASTVALVISRVFAAGVARYQAHGSTSPRASARAASRLIPVLTASSWTRARVTAAVSSSIIGLKARPTLIPSPY